MAASIAPNSPETNYSNSQSPQTNIHGQYIPYSGYDNRREGEMGEDWFGSEMEDLTLKRAIYLITSEWSSTERIEFQAHLELFRLQTVVAESETKTFQLQMKAVGHCFEKAVEGNLPHFLHQGSSRLKSTPIPIVPFLDPSKIMLELSKSELRAGFGSGLSPLASAFESLLWLIKSIADLKQEKNVSIQTHAKRELARCTLNMLLQTQSYLDVGLKSRLINQQHAIIAETSHALEKYGHNFTRMRYLLIERTKAYSEIAEILYVLHELETTNKNEFSNPISMSMSSSNLNPNTSSLTSSSSMSRDLSQPISKEISNSPESSTLSHSENLQIERGSHSAPQTPASFRLNNPLESSSSSASFHSPNQSSISSSVILNQNQNQSPSVSSNVSTNEAQFMKFLKSNIKNVWKLIELELKVKKEEEFEKKGRMEICRSGFCTFNPSFFSMSDFSTSISSPKALSTLVKFQYQKIISNSKSIITNPS